MLALVGVPKLQGFKVPDPCEVVVGQLKVEAMTSKPGRPFRLVALAFRSLELDDSAIDFGIELQLEQLEIVEPLIQQQSLMNRQTCRVRRLLATCTVRRQCYPSKLIHDRALRTVLKLAPLPLIITVVVPVVRVQGSRSKPQVELLP